MQTVDNPFQACKDIFFKPNGVFAALKDRQNWSWVAFVVVIGFTILPNYFYFNSIDFDWYREFVISLGFSELSPAEQDLIRQNLTPSQVISYTIITAMVIYLMMNSILALYLNTVTKVDEENLNGWTDWFGLTWWISMPVVVSGIIATAIVFFSNDPQLSFDRLSPTALSFIFGIDMQSPWFSLTNNIRLESVWSIYLLAVGVSQWINIEARKAYFIAAFPFALIWGVWALIIAL